MFHSTHRFHAKEEPNMATGTTDKPYDPIYDDMADIVYYETLLDSGAPRPLTLPLSQPAAKLEQPLTTQDQEDTTVPSSDCESEGSPEAQPSTEGSSFYQNLARPSSKSTQAKELPAIPTDAPHPYETASLYQPLTPQSLDTYQALLKQTSDTQRESTPAGTEQESDEEYYILPAFAAGYKLIDIRNTENRYQLPQ